VTAPAAFTFYFPAAGDFDSLFKPFMGLHFWH
jgi:hypothetical protein